MTSNNLSLLKVLVVDDEPTMHTLVRDLLFVFGFRDVITMNSCRRAIDALRAQPFDFIITDWRMDDLDGIDLVRFVRSTSDSTFLTTPIIMLTGNTEETDVITARDAGINGYLAKPFSAAQFVEHIRAVIDNPSDFIVSTEFIGPDRRHRTDPVPDGVERRKVAGCGSF